MLDKGGTAFYIPFIALHSSFVILHSTFLSLPFIMRKGNRKHELTQTKERRRVAE